MAVDLGYKIYAYKKSQSARPELIFVSKKQKSSDGEIQIKENPVICRKVPTKDFNSVKREEQTDLKQDRG